MKKLGIICLALVLALGTLGVGFALWSETLYIDGTVYTGEVDVEWSYCGCFDVESKDVGSVSCEIDSSDPHILYITVDNGYPCYEADCEVEFTVTGTVPVIFEDIIITPDNFTLASDYGANDGELYITIVDGVSWQFHPGDSSALSFRVHVEQCALELTTYTFTIELVFVQYNESAYYP